MKASQLTQSLQADRETIVGLGLKPVISGQYRFSTHKGCPSCNGKLEFVANNGTKIKCLGTCKGAFTMDEVLNLKPSEPLSECLSEALQADSSAPTPADDDSVAPEVKTAEIVAPAPMVPPRVEPVEPEIPTGREPGSDDELAAAPPCEPVKSTFVWGIDFCKQPPTSNAIIRGIVDYDSLGYIFGDSEAGKTFVALDRDLHIAHGIPWRGRKTKQGIVLYIVGEGKHGLIKRVKAWHEFHGLPINNNIAYRTVPAELCNPQAVNSLTAEIKSIIRAMNRRITLIELDTLNRNFGQGDENSTKDMTMFVRGMDDLRSGSNGAAISTVHHCGHSSKDRSRGSIVLFNSVDFAYCVSKEGETFNDYVTTMKFMKVKDYDKPQPLSWKWNRQDLPWAEEDDNGNIVPMNSVVLTPIDYQEKPKSKQLGDKQRKALDCLTSLFTQYENNLVADGRSPEGVRVSVKDWDEAMKGFEDNSGNRSRTRKTLKDNGFVFMSDGYVKIVPR